MCARLSARAAGMRDVIHGPALVRIERGRGETERVGEVLQALHHLVVERDVPGAAEAHDLRGAANGLGVPSIPEREEDPAVAGHVRPQERVAQRALRLRRHRPRPGAAVQRRQLVGTHRPLVREERFELRDAVGEVGLVLPHGLGSGAMSSAPAARHVARAPRSARWPRTCSARQPRGSFIVRHSGATRSHFPSHCREGGSS